MGNSNLSEVKLDLEKYMHTTLDRSVNLIAQIDQDKKNTRKGILFFYLAQNHLSERALYKYYFENSITDFKQYYSLSGWSLVESCKYPTGWGMESPYEFIYALLSDNQELLSAFMELSTENLNSAIFKSELGYEKAKENPETFDYRYATYALQCVLKKDWETVFKLRAFCHKKSVKLIRYQFEFYEALYHADRAKMEEMIVYFLRPRVVTLYNNGDTHFGYGGKLYSFPAVFFMKLAWIFGHEIHIEHPLMPMDLMPIKPLAHYLTIDEFFDSEIEAYNAELREKRKNASFWNVIKRKLGF